MVLEVRDGALIERGLIRQSPVEEAKPPAGCKELDLELFEGTDFDWIRFEAALAISCEDEPRPLRFGTFYCEPLEQFGIPEGDLPDEIDDEAAVSICWPEHYDRGEIRRSVVTGDVLWTVGHRTVQANDLQTYEVLARVTL